MSHSISTLLTRNLHDVSLVKTILRAEEPPSTRFSSKTVCSMRPTASTTVATRSIRWQARSKPLTLTFDIR